MIPRLRALPTLERLGRRVLHARGLESRRIVTDAGSLHAYDGAGRGPLAPVVVIHGISSNATAFAPLLLQLQRGASRVSALEMPGHGFSAPPSGPLDPDALMHSMTQGLDRLIDDPVVLCGNSLGGAVALHYAVHRPEKVKALVLLSPAGARMTPDELAGVLATFRIQSSRDARAFFGKLYRTPWFARSSRATSWTSSRASRCAICSPRHPITWPIGRLRASARRAPRVGVAPSACCRRQPLLLPRAPPPTAVIGPKASGIAPPRRPTRPRAAHARLHAASVAGASSARSM